MVGQHRLAGIGDVDPAHRHRHDLRAGGFDGGAGLLEIAVFPGADQQPRTETPTGDDQIVGRGRVVDRGRVGAAADEMHDLDAVALGEGDVAIARAGHDLQIALQGHLADVEAKRLQELGNRQRRSEFARLAVDL